MPCFKSSAPLRDEESKLEEYIKGRRPMYPQRRRGLWGDYHALHREGVHYISALQDFAILGQKMYPFQASTLHIVLTQYNNIMAIQVLKHRSEKSAVRCSCY